MKKGVAVPTEEQLGHMLGELARSAYYAGQRNLSDRSWHAAVRRIIRRFGYKWSAEQINKYTWG